MSRSRSEVKAFATVVNFAACLLNVGMAWAFHDNGSDWYIMNVMAGIFSGALTFFNFLGWVNAKDEEELEKKRQRLYNR